MTRPLRTLLTFCVLGGTGLLLLADSARQCKHPEWAQSFAVSGSCGPAGVFTVRSAADACEVTAEGAAELGLPSRGEVGNSGDPNDGNWVLVGDALYEPARPDGGQDADGGEPDGGAADGGPTRVSGHRLCTPSAGTLTCTDGSSPDQAGGDAACTSTLTPQ